MTPSRRRRAAKSAWFASSDILHQMRPLLPLLRAGWRGQNSGPTPRERLDALCLIARIRARLDCLETQVMRLECDLKRCEE